MPSPLWKYPGTLNGRIDPAYAEAQTLESGFTGVYYYGTWFFYIYSYDAGDYTSYEYTYAYESGHVFCLGEDANTGPDYRLSQDDIAGVYQTNVDLTGIDILYFAWKLNNPATMPQPVTILSAGTCQFVTTDVMVATGDDLPGILLPVGASVLFDSSYSERILRVSGAPSAVNNGDFRISAVPQNQGSMITTPSLNGRFAVLENDLLVAEAGAAVTLTVLGAQWVARAYIDTMLCCELREPGCSHHRGRSKQRNELSAHVSKLAGVHTVKFELSIELIAS